MVHDTSRVSRTDLRSKAEQQREGLEDIHEDMEDVTDDELILRDLENQIDWSGGTSEGLDDMSKSLDGADRAAQEEFDGHDAQLEQSHNETQEFENEVGDLGRAAEGNLGRLSDLTAPLKTKEVIDAAVDMKEAGVREVEELHSQEDDIRGINESSEATAERLRQIMRGE